VLLQGLRGHKREAAREEDNFHVMITRGKKRKR
jgi:hypothetical protein